jgi:uncharacterized protein (DUF2062 family)
MFKRRKSVGFFRRVRNFIWPEIGIHRATRYLSHRINRIAGSPHAIALGFAAGAFASFTPLVGFHFVIAATIAWIIGGNILASAIGTAVGNPISFPFIWVAAHNTGSWILGEQVREKIILSPPEGGIALLFSSPGQFFAELWNGLEPVFWPMAVGGIPLGLLCGAICYAVLKPMITRYKERRTRLREARSKRSGDRKGAAGRHGASA